MGLHTVPEMDHGFYEPDDDPHEGYVHEDDVEELRDALRAVLLFHSGEPWTQSVDATWSKLTGSAKNPDGAETTTRGLCDHIRAVLGEEIRPKE